MLKRSLIEGSFWAFFNNHLPKYNKYLEIIIKVGSKVILSLKYKIENVTIIIIKKVVFIDFTSFKI